MEHAIRDSGARSGWTVQGREQVHLLKSSRKLENLKVMKNVREIPAAAPIDAKEIARAQLLRFRRRLGSLTHDQELQIEDLVISTVTKVSSITGRLLESLGLELCNEPRGNNEVPKC